LRHPVYTVENRQIDVPFVQRLAFRGRANIFDTLCVACYEISTILFVSCVFVALHTVFVYVYFSTTCVDADVILDFRLSHGDESSREKFKNQLKNFLLLAIKKTELNAAISGQLDKLLNALHGGKKVCCYEDIEAYISTQKIINAFEKNRDKIIWDEGMIYPSQVTEKGLEDFHLSFLRRKMRTLKCIHDSQVMHNINHLVVIYIIKTLQ